MTTFDRVKLLAEKQKISIVELEEKLGFGRNSLYSWKKKTPSGANLLKVADYFGVSTDYLLGRESPEKEVKPETDLAKSLENIMSFNGNPINDHDKEVIMAYLEGKFGDK